MNGYISRGVWRVDHAKGKIVTANIFVFERKVCKGVHVKQYECRFEAQVFSRQVQWPFSPGVIVVDADIVENLHGPRIYGPGGHGGAAAGRQDGVSQGGRREEAPHRASRRVA